jgi:hypothetical protein
VCNKKKKKTTQNFHLMIFRTFPTATVRPNLFNVNRPSRGKCSNNSIHMPFPACDNSNLAIAT